MSVMSGSAEYRQPASKQAVPSPARDALTGLGDRTALEQRLHQALITSHEDGFHHALCHLDLDYFRTVSSRFGRATSDDFLRQLSQFLSSRIRPQDLLVRLHSDEFGLLLEHCIPDTAWHFARELCQTVTRFRIERAGCQITTAVSIGVARVSSTSGTVEDILHAAAQACRRAKALGRNQVYLEMSRSVQTNHPALPPPHIIKLPGNHG